MQPQTWWSSASYSRGPVPVFRMWFCHKAHKLFSSHLWRDGMAKEKSFALIRWHIRGLNHWHRSWVSGYMLWSGITADQQRLHLRVPIKHIGCLQCISILLCPTRPARPSPEAEWRCCGFRIKWLSYFIIPLALRNASISFSINEIIWKPFTYKCFWQPGCGS